MAGVALQPPMSKFMPISSIKKLPKPFRKILFLQSTSEIGGTDVSLLRILEKLDRRRFQPVVVIPSEGPMLNALRAQDCRVIIVKEMLKLTTRKKMGYLLLYVLNYPVAVLKIAGIIHREEIDLVHTNTLHNLYGFAAAKLCGRPHVWHLREIVLQSKFFRSFELSLTRRFADKIIVTSQAVADMFLDGARTYPEQMVKIPNGIDTEVFHPANSGEEIYRDLNIPPHTPLVGLVCRIDHWKGVDTFLQAVSICTREYHEARYLIVGGPIEGREDYAKKMVELADTLGIRERVYFTNWRYKPADMPKVHAALSILVLASSWPEPFGLVLVEAMASGKPVIATDHGGPREICVHGETAMMVRPCDPREMAAAILTLLCDAQKARKMGQAGRERVEILFDQALRIHELEALYDELLTQNKKTNLSAPT